MRELAANLATMLTLSWRADRARSVGALVTVAVTPVSATLRAVGVAVIVDGVVSGDRPQALRGVCLVAALTAVTQLLAWANLVLRMRLREHTILYVDQQVMRLVGGLPGLEHHERPEYQDRLELLRRHRGTLVNPFLPLAWTLAGAVQLVTTVAVLARLHPLLALLPVAGVPALWASTRAERRWRELWEAQAERYRRLNQIFELATLPAAAKEVRLFGLTDDLLRRHRASFEVSDRSHLATGVRTALMRTGGWAVFGVAYTAAMALVADAVRRGELSVGAMVLVLTLGGQLSGQVTEMSSLASWFTRTAQAVGHYRWLVGHIRRHDLDDGVGDPLPAPERLHEGIRLEGVGFTYPGTDLPVVSGVDLDLPAGMTVAVVGENGAGKTTLVKLLLRFYAPTAGRIRVDGADLAEMAVEDWRERAAAGFQDFARFQFLARQSIGVGSLPLIDDHDAVCSALARAGAEGLRGELGDDLGTQLGRDFEQGVDLSTGQWQQVALGRTMMRATPLLVVLDEPTASLDAGAEHGLFEAIARQSRRTGAATGTVTVLVSHRFSTVRMADRIVVMERGRVSEVGTHDELVSLGGRYAELYDLQARAYR